MARHRVNPDDVLRLGSDVAQLKASVSRKRWKRLVRSAHSRGFTVAGQLSGAPDPLKERLPSSLRDEANRTIAETYKPVQTELDRRGQVATYLEGKRAQDDAAYRTWLSGEVGKLDAQSTAADATLATQQSDIATEQGQAQKAAAADSFRRVQAQAGNVSDPHQSTALDYSAADTRSNQMVADARTHSAAVAHIGAGADEIAKAALNATVAVREATRRTELWKTQGEIASDRQKAASDQAHDTLSLWTDLKNKEVDKATANREYGLAGQELGIKQAGIEADVLKSKQDYKLANKKFNLAKWIAHHKDRADRLKRDLDYDKIASTEGIAAANRALRERIASDDRHERRIEHRDTKAGIGKDERQLYRDIQTAKGLIARWARQGKPMAGVNQHLRNLGVSDPQINVAYDLWRRERAGQPGLSASGYAQARRLGVIHPRYFWS